MRRLQVQVLHTPQRSTMLGLLLLCASANAAYTNSPGDLMVLPATSSAVNQSSPPTGVVLNFTHGSSVKLVGDWVSISCQSNYSAESGLYTWYHRNQPTGAFFPIGNGSVLTRANLRLSDSGQYKCMFREAHGIIELTVLERISNLSVVASPQDLFVFEGHSVTLECIASSAPTLISWTWYRLGEAGSQSIASERVLTLSRAEETGEYYCHANSSMLGISQQETSQNHKVYIIPMPVECRLGVAAFALTLLCWIFIILIIVVALLLMQRGTDSTALNMVPMASPAKGLPASAKGTKADLQQPTDDEVYMNCEGTGEAYSDLNPNHMIEENTYDCLS
ncbi:Fc receptor-like protein 3 [Megalops cyprinoides]|uniref:Fc receptor-like protein 3 n=1 Tax=Megalops cyprinoides TaxID=118141 RepID=UPI0018641A04|nr:Fc receptor-like protein 3 [Megalops cyprinoides]